MSAMHRLRAYHALLASLVVIAYASGDVEPIHNWLGYAVALIVVARLLWAATGVPQLGLMRFYPNFEGLKLGTAMSHPAISRTLLLGIAVCLVGATATGVAMDQGRALGIAYAPNASTTAHSTAKGGAKVTKVEVGKEHRSEDESEGMLSEAHELFANLLMGFVGLHVGYLLLFKRPLARFMLFLDRPKA
jgi:cytochrome b